MGEKTKKPFQVYLMSDQIDALRSLSKRRGESMAALAREGVDKILEEAQPEVNPLLEIIGKFNSQEGNLAEKHDEAQIALIKAENIRE